MAATRARIDKQNIKSTTPRSLVYTDLTNEQIYFAPPTGADYVLQWDDSASNLAWLPTTSLINIYNNDGTITGTRIVSFDNPLSFEYDDGTMQATSTFDENVTFNSNDSTVGNSTLLVSPALATFTNFNLTSDITSGYTISDNLVRLNVTNGTTADSVYLTLTDQSGIITSSYSTFPGFQYNADYSANFTTHSLVTKDYVDTVITGVPGDFLGTGFTAGGGSGTIPVGTTGTISYPSGGIDALQFIETVDPGVTTITETGFSGTSSTGITSKMVLRQYIDLVFPEASETNVDMQVADGTNSSRFAITSPTTMLFNAIDGDNEARLNVTGSGINASASDNLTESESYFQVTSSTVIFSTVDDSGATDLSSTLTMTQTNATLAHTDATNNITVIDLSDSGPVITNEVNGLGAQYAAEYLDILTNDRSIPDVGLTKDLIASEANNIYNSDGTIPASAYRTATIGAAAALDFQYSNAATAFKISDDEEFVEIRSKDGSSFLNFSSIGTSLNTPNLSFNGGTTIADNTTLKLQGFKFQTDDDPTYNPDGFFSQLVFGGSYSIVDGSFQPAVGSSSFTAGDPLVSPTFAQFYFNGEEKSIGMQGVNIDDNLKSYIVTNQSSVTLGSNSGSDIVTFQVDATGTSFADNRATKVGIQYGSDYGATFTDRSLVDKEYVDTHSGSALGVGFTAGGGAGTIPAGTTIAVQPGGDFILDLSAPMANGDISYIGDVGANIGINISGTTFTLQGGNGGMSISADDEKVVLTGNGVVLPSLTTAQRNSLTGLSVGQTIYNTDATATDSSTGVMQVWNGVVWKDASAEYSTEIGQDAIGTILVDTDTIDLTYNDGTPSITAAARLQMSITSDASGIKLVNDASTPGNEKYYGTDGTGVKGFFDLPTGVNIYNADGTLTGTRVLTGGTNALRFNFDDGAGITSDYIGGVNYQGWELQDTVADLTAVSSLSSTDLFINLSDNSSGEAITIQGTVANLDLYRLGTTGTQGISFSGSGLVITDSDLLQGMKYAASYAAYFATNPRSIPDVGYVQSLIAASPSGTVTSVALALPSIFTVSGSPVTTSGTLTGTLATQTANTIFAGPTSGGAATPTFRALVAADITAGGGITGTYTDEVYPIGTGTGIEASDISRTSSALITSSEATRIYGVWLNNMSALTSGFIAGSGYTGASTVYAFDGSRAGTGALATRIDNAGTGATFAHIKGNTTGDSYTLYNTGGANNYSVGIDASDTHAFKIMYGANPSTGTTLIGASSGGNVGIRTAAHATQQIHLSGTLRLTLGSDATGDTYYRNSSGAFTRLAAGTNGHVLTLASGIPSWAALPAADGNGIYTGSGSLSGNTTVTMGTNSILFSGIGATNHLTTVAITPASDIINLRTRDLSIGTYVAELYMEPTFVSFGLQHDTIPGGDSSYINFQPTSSTWLWGNHEIIMNGSGISITDAVSTGLVYTADYSANILANNSSIPDIFTVRENAIENYSTITSTTSPVNLNGVPPDYLINQGSTQATFTFSLPASPVNGEVCKLTFANAVTTLTITAQGGITILGAAPTTAAIGTQLEYKYYHTITSWIRVK